MEIKINSKNAEEAPLERSPERALCAAILARAILDLVDPDPRERRTAKAFFRYSERWGTSKLGFTFEYICSELDLNPLELRKLVKEKHCKILEFRGRSLFNSAPARRRTIQNFMSESNSSKPSSGVTSISSIMDNIASFPEPNASPDLTNCTTFSASETPPEL